MPGGPGREQEGWGAFSAVLKAAGCAERSGVPPATLVCLAVCGWMLAIPLANSPLSSLLKTQRSVRQPFFSCIFFLSSGHHRCTLRVTSCQIDATAGF